MKKNYFLMVLAIVLALSASVAFVMSLSRSLGEVSDKNSDISTSTETDNLKETVSLDTGSNSTVNVYSKLISETNSGDYHFCYVTHATDGYTMFGIYTTVLEPEKLHKIEWTINADMYDGALDVPYDGAETDYRFYLAPSYQPNQGLGYSIAPDNTGDFDAMLDNEITFTSGAEGSTFSFLFARADVTDQATIKNLCDLMAESFSFKIYQLEE